VEKKKGGKERIILQDCFPHHLTCGRQRKKKRKGEAEEKKNDRHDPLKREPSNCYIIITSTNQTSNGEGKMKGKREGHDRIGIVRIPAKRCYSSFYGRKCRS